MKRSKLVFAGTLLSALSCSTLTYGFGVGSLIGMVGDIAQGDFSSGLSVLPGGVGGYIDMAMRIAQGDLSAIPGDVGKYLGMAQSIAGMVGAVSSAGVYGNYQMRNSEYTESEDGFNKDEINFLINAQVKHSPSREKILELNSLSSEQIQKLKNLSRGQSQFYSQGRFYSQGSTVNGSSELEEILAGFAKEYNKSDRTNEVADIDKIAADLSSETAESVQKKISELLEQIDGNADIRNHYTVLTLYHLGTAYKKAGKYEDGQRLLDKAIKIAEDCFGSDTESYPVCLEYLALISFQNAFYKDAEELYKTSYEFQKNQEMNTFNSLGLLVRCYLIQHRFYEARNYLEQMMNEKDFEKLVTSCGEVMDGAKEYAEKQSNYYKQYYDYYYNEYINQHIGASSQDITDVAEMRTHYASVLYYLGYYYMAEKKERDTLQVLDVLAKQNHGHTNADSDSGIIRIMAFERLAQIKIQQGKYTEAEKLLDESDALKESVYASQKNSYAANYGTRTNNSLSQEKYQLLFVSGNNIRAHLLSKEGKYQEAIDIYTNNLSALESQDEGYLFETAEIYRRRGQVSLKMNDIQSALEDFQSGSSLLSKAGRSEHQYYAVLNCDMAEVYIQQQEWTRAEEVLDSVKDIFKNVSADEQIRYHNILAQTYYGKGEKEKAVAELEKAVEYSLEARKNVALNEQVRANAFSEYYHLYETLVRWSQENGQYDKAYNAMEKSRALGLQELVKSSDIDPLKKDSEKAAELRNELSESRSRLNEAESQLTELKQRPAKDDAEIARLEQEVAKYRSAVIEAVYNIKMESSIYKKTGDHIEIDSFESAGAEFAKENTTVCEFLLGKETSFLLVYGAGFEKPFLAPLELSESAAEDLASLCPGKKLASGSLTTEKVNLIFGGEDGVLSRLSENPAESDDSELLESLGILWGVLFPDKDLRDALLSSDDDRSLLILPDGDLSSFPFEALVVGTNNTEPEYLIDKPVHLFYAPSAKFYRQGSESADRDLNSILTCGNPDYGQTLEEEPNRMLERSGDVGYLAPLPGTENETRWIADCASEMDIPALRFDGRETNEKNIRENVSGKDLVHIACHGILNTSDNMFGGLAVTPIDSSDPNNDGFITLSEMFDLDMSSCRLAILSACQTNLGQNQIGEGTWSLGRGILISGAHSVVTSDWSVSDESTATLMSYFVENCLAKKELSERDYASALQTAKRNIRQDKDHPEWSHPYYWAPFILIGSK